MSDFSVDQKAVNKHGNTLELMQLCLGTLSQSVVKGEEMVLHHTLLASEGWGQQPAKNCGRSHSHLQTGTEQGPVCAYLRAAMSTTGVVTPCRVLHGGPAWTLRAVDML